MRCSENADVVVVRNVLVIENTQVVTEPLLFGYTPNVENREGILVVKYSRLLSDR